MRRLLLLTIITGCMLNLANASSMLHNQFTALFLEMNNGFVNREILQIDADISYYNINTPIKGEGISNLVVHETGEIYFLASIKSTANAKENIVNALNSYPNMGGFSVTKLNERSNSVNYVVEKNNKNIGFVHILKEGDSWRLYAYLPMSDAILQLEIQKAINVGFEDALDYKGKFLDESDGMKYYESNKKLFNADFTYLGIDNLQIMWVSNYYYYPYEGLKYQLKKMDLSVFDIIKEEEETAVSYSCKFRNSYRFVILELNLNVETGEPGLSIVILDIDEYDRQVREAVVEGMTEEDFDFLLDPAAEVNSKLPESDWSYTSEERAAFPPPKSFPPFRGNYEGDNLIKMLGRHIEDPAVKGFVNQYEMKKFGNTHFRFEGAKGIHIRFRENRIYSIRIMMNGIPNKLGDYRGKLPYGLKHTDITREKVLSRFTIVSQEIGGNWFLFRVDGVEVDIKNPYMEDSFWDIVLEKTDNSYRKNAKPTNRN